MPDSNEEVRDRLAARPVVPISIPTITADTNLTSRPCLLCGWSLRETTGAATAAGEFKAGNDNTNPNVGEQALASAGTGSLALMDEGVLCEGGLRIHVVSGSLAGVAYVRI